MVRATGEIAPDAASAVTHSYAKGETDEFLAPSVIAGYAGIKDGDGLFCLNFRADRAREILAALGDPGFTAFETGARPKWSAMLGMVGVPKATTPIWPRPSPSGFWSTPSANGSRRRARRSSGWRRPKYPHVTFFLNGGREVPYPGEDRAMPPSPKVATYDLQPEMSADEVSDRFVEAIEAGYDLIVVNYANPDMVGHTGSLPAAIKACEAVDRGLGRALAALEKAGGRW